MSSLTEQERIGLEEVFLSISSAPDHAKELHGFKRILLNLIRRKRFQKGFKRPVLLVMMTYRRIKLSNLRHLFPKK